ncbi:MAG TPA: antibiotic biosynthesis monooxygenase family protein [Bryobacteraceae bacterium]
MTRILMALALTALAGFAQNAPATAVYVVAHIDVTPDHAAETAALVKQYAADSKKDKGIVRIDAVLQDGRTNHFTIVEVWQTRAAFEAHTALAHTVQYREKLHPFLGSPYDERIHGMIP